MCQISAKGYIYFFLRLKIYLLISLPAASTTDNLFKPSARSSGEIVILMLVCPPADTLLEITLSFNLTDNFSSFLTSSGKTSRIVIRFVSRSTDRFREDVPPVPPRAEIEGVSKNVANVGTPG